MLVCHVVTASFVRWTAIDICFAWSPSTKGWHIYTLVGIQGLVGINAVRYVTVAQVILILALVRILYLILVVVIIVFILVSILALVLILVLVPSLSLTPRQTRPSTLPSTCRGYTLPCVAIWRW